MFRRINKLWTKNVCGGLIPTRTTNHWPPPIIFFPCIFSVLIFCRSHVTMGEHQRQGEQAGLVIPVPKFVHVIRLPGWHVGGFCPPTVMILGRRGGSPYFSSSPEAPPQNQSSDFDRPDRSPDWLRVGCPQTVEEAVVRPRQAVWDRIPHDDGTPSGHELCIHGRGMVALRRHHRTRFAPSHHGIFNKTACWNHWKRN